MFIFFNILTPPIRKWSLFFMVAIASQIVGYSLYQGTWAMFGARFWYESVPFFIFLTLLGVENIPKFLPLIIPKLTITKTERKRVIAVSYVVIMCLSFYSLKQWYRIEPGTPSQWYSTNTPQNLHELQRFNYANADMVGHSGNFGATVKAVECLDQQLGILYNQIVTKMGGTMYVTADHGNAEDMYDEAAHQPRTAHTTNLVPFIMLRADLQGKGMETLPLKGLSDIAPFILKNMDLSIPKEMI